MTEKKRAVIGEQWIGQLTRSWEATSQSVLGGMRQWRDQAENKREQLCASIVAWRQETRSRLRHCLTSLSRPSLGFAAISGSAQGEPLADMAWLFRNKKPRPHPLDEVTVWLPVRMDGIPLVVSGLHSPQTQREEKKSETQEESDDGEGASGEADTTDTDAQSGTIEQYCFGFLNPADCADLIEKALRMQPWLPNDCIMYPMGLDMYRRVCTGKECRHWPKVNYFLVPESKEVYYAMELKKILRNQIKEEDVEYNELLKELEKLQRQQDAMGMTSEIQSLETTSIEQEHPIILTQSDVTTTAGPSTTTTEPQPKQRWPWFSRGNKVESKDPDLTTLPETKDAPNALYADQKEATSADTKQEEDGNEFDDEEITVEGVPVFVCDHLKMGRDEDIPHFLSYRDLDCYMRMMIIENIGGELNKLEDDFMAQAKRSQKARNKAVTAKGKRLDRLTKEASHAEEEAKKVFVNRYNIPNEIMDKLDIHIESLEKTLWKVYNQRRKKKGRAVLIPAGSIHKRYELELEMLTDAMSQENEQNPEQKPFVPPFVLD